MTKLLLIVFIISSSLIVAPAQGKLELPAGDSGIKSAALKSKMVKAFGGKRNLNRVAYITYTLSRKSYQDGDSVMTKQLWYMHMKNPVVVKLEINGTDTTTFSTTFYNHSETTESLEEKAIYEGLLRSRLFNFLYLLTTEEAEFHYIKKYSYNNSQTDIVRATSSLDPRLSIDLFVNRKGEIVTSSIINQASGAYERFGDEHSYEQVEGGIVFPLQYKVMHQGNVVVEGIFSDMQVNRLSPFWEKHLKSIGAIPFNPQSTAR